MDNVSNINQKTLLKRLLLGMQISLFARLGVASLAFMLQILLARLMGVTEYGMYVFLLSWAMIGAKFVTLGFDTSLVKFSAAYQVRNQWILLNSIWKYANLLTLLAGCILCLSCILLLFLLRYQNAAYYYSVLLIPLLGMSSLRQSLIQSFKRVGLAVIPDGYFKPISLAVAVIIIYLATGTQPDAGRVMIIHVLIAFVSVCCGSLLVKKLLPSQLPKSVDPPYKGWVKVSLPLLLVNSIVLIQNQTDILMLGILVAKSDSGVYAVAARLSEVVSYGLIAINSIFAPICAELYEQNNKLTLQTVITRAARLGCMFALLVGVLLYFAGDYILSLFGSPFLEGKSSLYILLLGQLINTAIGPVGMIMAMSKHQKQLAWISLLSLIINILFNLMLIPLLGMLGAAIATTTSIILWNIIAFFSTKRRAGLRSSIIG